MMMMMFLFSVHAWILHGGATGAATVYALKLFDKCLFAKPADFMTLCISINERRLAPTLFMQTRPHEDDNEGCKDNHVIFQSVCSTACLIHLRIPASSSTALDSKCRALAGLPQACNNLFVEMSTEGLRKPHLS
jgi:hypothetical protein